MSLWGAFTGSDARRYATDAYHRNSREMQTGYDRSMGYQGQGYQSAVNRLSPYAQAGQQGQQAYTNLLGLNGQQAQQGARQGYEGWNPYLSNDISMADRAISRRSASMGQMDSGLNALARNRSAMGMGTQDFYNYNDRLQGLGQQGFQASNLLAGYDLGNAQSQIGIENALRNGNVQNSTQFGNAQSAANQSGLNNAIAAATAAAQMAFGMPPTGARGIGGGQQVYSQGGNAMNGGWSTTATTASPWSRMFGGGMNSFGFGS